VVSINPKMESSTSEWKSYVVTAPDTTQITATVADGVAEITIGGTSLSIPLEFLEVLAELVSSLAVQNPPILPPPPPGLPALSAASQLGTL
jgi:hypothetical protein